MTIDPETLMAYADGELDPLNAKRVERAMAADPALAVEVERHRALRQRIAGSFAPVTEEPVPERLASLLTANVVSMPRRSRPAVNRWTAMAAMAACLVLGLTLGIVVNRGPVTARGNGLYASAQLADALDNQLSGTPGAVKITVSFRDRQGSYCRVFSLDAAAGIACRDQQGWSLRRTQSGSVQDARGGYAQAASPDPDLMAAAQDMMAGQPLDAPGERTAKAAKWQSR